MTPEASPVFCILPWVHMNVWPDGKVYPCCMADNSRPVGDLRRSSLAEAWNSEPMRRLRRNMLEGRPSPECSKCYELDKSGCSSLRRRANRDFARHAPRARQTRADGSAPGPLMAYLDVRFSNLCNFRCRTCCPELSSAWHADGQRLWGPIPRPALLTPTEDPQALWDQLEPLLPDLEEVYFAGGEPLLMEEHYRVLDRLIERRMFQVRLVYNTNFSTTTWRGRDVMESWDLFETVRVGASLDGMGPRGEYLRTGQSWERVLLNRERMFKACPRADFIVTSTLSLMNALHLPDFHEEWLRLGLVGPAGWHINMLLCPEEYRIQVLPPALRDQVLHRYTRHIEAVLEPLGEAGRDAAGQYRAALAFLDGEDRSAELPRLLARVRALDAIRGEDFRGVFPELASLGEAQEARVP